MNVGILGGTFDPIHRGHMALAKAAAQQFKLGRVHFVPASVPPHKRNQQISSFAERYAMVALATADEKKFVPSLLEAPPEHGNATAINYSLDTVRRLKQQLRKEDRLFFLIGIDAFREIASWHEAESLFRECEFVVASRPGYFLADVANSLPKTLRPPSGVTKPFARYAAKGDLILPGVRVYLLENVHYNLSATKIRAAASAGRPLGRYLDAGVADYIKKTGLYRQAITS